MRISRPGLATVAVLLLGACGDHQPAGAPLDNGDATTNAASVDRDGRVECRLAGSNDFQRLCEVERRDTGALTLRNPNGGFHRLRITDDGRGVAAADGAEAAEVTIAGTGQIEVAIGGDRYRLPATIRPTPHR